MVKENELWGRKVIKAGASFATCCVKNSGLCDRTLAAAEEVVVLVVVVVVVVVVVRGGGEVGVVVVVVVVVGVQ